MSDNVNKMPELKVGMLVRIAHQNLKGMVVPYKDTLAVALFSNSWLELHDFRGEYKICEVYECRKPWNVFASDYEDISIWKLEEKSTKQLEIERLEDIITNAYKSMMELKMENV